jgi:hypothetical protein
LLWGSLFFLKAKVLPKVKHRNDFAPQIDDALHKIRGPGDRDYLLDRYNLPDFLDIHAVSFRAQTKGHDLPAMAGVTIGDVFLRILVGRHNNPPDT